MKQILIAMFVSGVLAAGAYARPKSYSVSMPEKIDVGSVALKPGNYHLRLDGSTAIFLNDDSKEVAKAPVTVTNADRKFAHTEVLYSRKADNTEQLTGVDLGGTRMKLQFRN